MESFASPESEIMKKRNKPQHKEMFLPDIGNDDNIPSYGGFL